MQPTKSFLEFFAGIGLVHEGLRADGWQCAYANDIEAKKRAMYEGHFGTAPYYQVEDVWNAKAVLVKIPVEPAFLATASFPCIDLSLAGHWRGFGGEQSSTYFGFLDVLRRLGSRRPPVVMLENVSGFLTSRNGADFARAVQELAALGYWIDAMALDARLFVPQSRPRVFVFGFHETLACDQLLRRTRHGGLFDSWQHAIEQSASLRPQALRQLFDTVILPTGWATMAFDPPIPNRPPLASVIDIGDDQAWWDDETTRKHLDMMEQPSRQRVGDLLKNCTTAVGTAFRRTRRGATRLEVRFDLAGCLRTPKGGSAKQIIVALSNQNVLMRWMTPIEYARLQGAPNFNIDVPPLQAMYGFGDAVCVPAIQWLSKTILSPLYENTIHSAARQSA